MFVHALSGAASFAACLRLFRSYPLAVNYSYPGHPQLAEPSLELQLESPLEDSLDGLLEPPLEPWPRGEGQRGPLPLCRDSGWQRSMILRHRGFEGSGFYVLTEEPAERFTLRPWNPADGECQEIRPGTQVNVTSHRVITEGMPVPRDGALLGWVSDRQATVLLLAHHGHPASRVQVPQVRVLAMVGSEPVRWPPFAISPLDDGLFWDYAERGEMVDLTPVVVHDSEGTFWIPSQNPGRAGQGHGCVVVNRNLQVEDYWVPAGTYMDHWMLREGVPAPSASHLLTLPGTTRLSRRLAAW